jgi:6-phospho-beta-glucosidase
MSKGIKLTQIGGGSTYTPDFADILIRRKDDLKVDEWVLMDIDGERCEIVSRVCRKMLEGAGLDIKITCTTNMSEAVQNADYVVTTIRVGGSESRLHDESIPSKHGLLLGQETTAPGGMLMGLRNIPVMLDLAKEMEAHAKPNAWLVNLTNPSGMLAEALNMHSQINFAGLCNGPTVARTAMAQVFKVDDPQDIFCKLIGLNHLIWMKVYLKGEDVTEEAIQRMDQWYAENIPPMRQESPPLYIQEFVGWLPIGPYLRFYYELPEAIDDIRRSAERWPGMLEFVKDRLGGLLDDFNTDDLPTRAHLVKALEEKTLELYAQGDVQGYELTRNTRGGKGYAEAGLSLISAIENDKYEIHGPDVPSRGTIPGLDPNAVATTTALVNRAGIHPLAMDPLPPHAMSFVQSAKIYERLAVEAAVTGSYHAALEALIANPLVVSYNQAKAALDELLLVHAPYLPHFSDAIGKLKRGEDPLK